MLKPADSAEQKAEPVQHVTKTAYLGALCLSCPKSCFTPNGILINSAPACWTADKNHISAPVTAAGLCACLPE